LSKFASSRYRRGRSKTWLKTKCFAESELTLLASTATARPQPNVRSAPSQRVVSLPMQDQLSLLCASRPESPNSTRSVQRFNGWGIVMHAGWSLSSRWRWSTSPLAEAYYGTQPW